MPRLAPSARRLLAGAAVACALAAGLSGCVLAPVVQTIVGTPGPDGATAPAEAPAVERDPGTAPTDEPAPEQAVPDDGDGAPGSPSDPAPDSPAPTDTGSVLGPPDEPRPAPTITTQFDFPVES